ncbi:MAG: cyclic nucleotide-binding domain-containing protein [Rhodocyclaceae bacterium]|nr:cyclic nucleotide-binding domain-containing protein [Rhodocyclaceae bacterium]
MGLFDYSNAADSVEPLQEITFLADLSSEDWARVLKIVKSRVFRAGDDLIRAGDKDDSFYILTSGEVEVTIGDKVLATIPEGSVFGEISFLTARCAARRSAQKPRAVQCG